MARKEFPKPIKVARLKHATREGVIFCEGCGILLKPGQFDFDHANPDAMTGKPTFENCRVLCRDKCHSEKTKRDKAEIAKAKRREARDLHVMPAPKAPILSAGFPRSQRTLDRESSKKPPMPPRRNIYTGKPFA